MCCLNVRQCEFGIKNFILLFFADIERGRERDERESSAKDTRSVVSGRLSREIETVYRRERERETGDIAIGAVKST